MNDCIKTLQPINSAGYGQEYYDGALRGAHRVAYCRANKISIDSIKGKTILHTCDNPTCVNPEHLVLGTQTDNMRDKVAKGRANAAKGEAIPNSVLTPAIVLELRAKAAKGIYSYRELGEMFNISRGTAYNAVTKKLWRHV